MSDALTATYLFNVIELVDQLGDDEVLVVLGLIPLSLVLPLVVNLHVVQLVGLHGAICTKKIVSKPHIIVHLNF
jgi:hypothetical protein